MTIKVIDLISVITDQTIVEVVDESYDLLAIYDGKNSIPEELNDNEILSVSLDTASVDLGAYCAIMIQVKTED